MVIDWNKQIDECIKNTKIMPIFHGKEVSNSLQEILVIKRLCQDGYTDQEILNWMLLADSKLVHDIDDVESLKKHALTRRWPKKHDFKIYVTMDEINYIDQIKTTKEKKSYLLGLMCFAKMMKIKHKKPTFKPQYRAYVYYIATGIDGYSKGKQCYKSINEFTLMLIKKKIIDFKDNRTGFTVYTSKGPIHDEIRDSLFKAKWVNWDAEDGYCITNLETDVQMLVNQAFHDPTKICSNCGKEFIITPYTKTCLCHDCQKTAERARTQQWKLKHPDVKHSKPGVPHDKNKTHSHGKRDQLKLLQNGDNGGGK